MSRLSDINQKDLAKLIKESFSYREVLEKLGYSRNSGSVFYKLRDKISDFKIDTSHFGTQKKSRHKLKDILIKNSKYTNIWRLKKRLIKAKILREECYICGILPKWNGKPLSLQLDHINGDFKDHRLENIRLLCPNCHSQTETFAGRNNGQ